MPRRKFNLSLPFREIKPTDAKQPFANELQPINRIDLSYLVDLNVGSRHIFVYDLDGKVLGFITFLDRGDHFHIDLVEANRIHQESAGTIKPGFLLITLVENLSRQLGHSRITLHSIQERIPYYRALGYKVTGDPIQDPNYGLLSPMEKSL